MTGRRGGVVTWALVAVIAALVGAQLLDPWADDAPPGGVPPAQRVSAQGILLGVTTLSLARNADRPWRPSDLREVDAFERRARRHADIVMWFADWAQSRFDPEQAAAVRRRGSIPEITWEPWDARIAPGRPQPDYRLATIIAGRHDAVIRRFATAVARYGGPVRLRFAQEMNGRLYPWAERVNGNRPGDFVRAWRHVHRLFAAAGARNVTWIWAPVVGAVRASQYPGASQVDVVGVSGFNGGTETFAKRWRPFRPTFDPSLDFVARLAPGKPLALPEIASAEAGGDKAAWITDMLHAANDRRRIRAIVWFDVAKEADWRISSSAAAQAAFARGVARLRR